MTRRGVTAAIGAWLALLLLAVAIPANALAPDRRYSKQELIATIPADADYKYPLTLAYLFPIYRDGFAGQAEFLITLYTGKDRPERLIFWKKVDDDQYQQARVMEAEGPDFHEQHFETPTVFFPKGQVPGEGVLCVDVPMDGYRSHADQVFVIDRSELLPVEIEAPEKWYKDKLGPREEVWFSARNSFSDEGLDFAFTIWNADDAMCCPTGGQVMGSYKLVKETAGLAGAVAFSPITGEILKGVPKKNAPIIVETQWKMVVDTAQRK